MVVIFDGFQPKQTAPKWGRRPWRYLRNQETIHQRKHLNAWTSGYAAPGLLEARRCQRLPMSMAWLACCMSWQAAIIRSVAYLQRRRAMPGWRAHSRRRAICPGAVGLRYERHWLLIRGNAVSARCSCMMRWVAFRSGGEAWRLNSAFPMGMQRIKLMNFSYRNGWRSLIQGHGEPP
ncbi:hypothetical protein J2W43_006109 [Pseudomonas brassicacearum]|uniref:Uncharacterized protein n=1 Tax=Pseudomonas brassicacearum TaxID=930166 RepID=A0AAW8MKC5_9PSED|nr:hypothetical protein [Pseudomonas brassicacearum]